MQDKLNIPGDRDVSHYQWKGCRSDGLVDKEQDLYGGECLVESSILRLE